MQKALGGLAIALFLISVSLFLKVGCDCVNPMAQHQAAETTGKHGDNPRANQGNSGVNALASQSVSTVENGDKAPANESKHGGKVDEGKHNIVLCGWSMPMGEFLIALFTFFLVIVTGLVWAATYGLFSDAKETSRAQLRAYVGVDSVIEKRGRGYKGKEVLFSFAPRWTNYGVTPTRHMTTFVKAEFIDINAPINFDFLAEQTNVGRLQIGPKTSLTGAFNPEPGLTKSQILEVHHGRKRLIIWGWTKYHDVLSDSKERVTRFSFDVFVLYNPAPEPNDAQEGIVFNYMIPEFNNCADEECGAT